MSVDAYLARIGFSERPSVDLAALEALQRAHLSLVPFENLDVYHGIGVGTDLQTTLDKIVHQRRGGWCFEVNGAFAWLLEQLGFAVTRLGAAVLLDGPNAVVDHLTIEVSLDGSWLVDVGFGDSFIRPLDLNRAGPQDGGSATFEFIPSALGTTFTRHDADGFPQPCFRFKRVAHALGDFEAASRRLQSDRSTHWHRWPFATRLIDGGPDRVTLLADRLKLVRSGQLTETPVSDHEWNSVLEEWFSMRGSDA